MTKLKSVSAIIALALAAVMPQSMNAQQAAQTPSSIPADRQPTRQQLAKLFEVMRLRQQMESLMKTMPAMMQQQIQAQYKEMAAKMPGGNHLTPEQQAAFDKFLDKYMEKAMNLYPVSELIDDMSTIYQRHLSREDVDAFIAFYSSPAGQHLLDEQPAIMKEYMPLVMSRMQDRSKNLTDEMMHEMENMMKQPPASSASPEKR